MNYLNPLITGTAEAIQPKLIEQMLLCHQSESPV